MPHLYIGEDVSSSLADYSTLSFKLHGQICLGGFICFGLFSIVSVRYVQPELAGFLELIHNTVAIVMCIVLMIMFIYNVISILKVV